MIHLRRISDNNIIPFEDDNLAKHCLKEFKGMYEIHSIQPTITKQSYKDIPVTIIKPQAPIINYSDMTLKEFKEKLTTFTKDDLSKFENQSKYKTIVKLAKNEQRKLK